MSKVAVVTDSTAYIPKSLVNGHKIEIAPLQLIWGEEQFRDGIDIKPFEFYNRLQNASIMPSTSQTTPMAFKQIYENLLEQGYDILSIHISSKLSGTMDSAIQAKQMIKSSKIELIDSENTGMALGFQALAVANRSANGATLAECKEIAEIAKEHTQIYFAVKTLEFLKRGGRIGGAAAFFGTVLDLKPILEVRDGRIEAVEKVRTFNKALDRMLDLVENKIGNQTPIRLAIQHANAPIEAEAFLEKARGRFGINEVSDAVIAEVSPVIGTHTGPGTLGIAFMYGM